MSQEEVYKFLKENKHRLWTSKEIAEKVGLGVRSVRANLHRLEKDGFVRVFEYKKRTNLNDPIFLFEVIDDENK